MNDAIKASIYINLKLKYILTVSLHRKIGNQKNTFWKSALQ